MKTYIKKMAKHIVDYTADVINNNEELAECLDSNGLWKEYQEQELKYVGFNQKQIDEFNKLFDEGNKELIDFLNEYSF